ncbi:protein ENHANCED DOWNY MILDEW 2 isoform X7 [Zea mays]|uniref:protein ENHANCED DOWNY MILDEW 2 isoform X7 n=1 Tax=Zea mays TaxID=4577 RepID=UPI0004DEBDE1|nr:protein ENHANCED DOWNY MILDEW 2 isoform X7 [Zea mays]|eukprot:XP_008669978.1 protein ENHANCED DOWNY MILDEW 2 isoform X7 [Zea mays]
MVMSESDDDDDEPQLNAVESYYFVDSTNDNEPVCFSTLPFLFGDTDDLPDCKKRLVLRGTGGDPGVKVYSEVVAWSLGLEGKQPQFAVLTAEGRRWVRLVRPLNSYEEMIRTVLITAHMLHFLMRKPHEPERTLWNHLCKVFNKFDVRPSEDDFRNHISLMKQFVAKDPILAKSEILRVFVEGKSGKIFTEAGADHIDVKQPFITDDEDIDEMIVEDADNESDEEEDGDLFDSICAICDDGGDILCCDGPCMRSFHAKEGSGEDSYCDTLGYTEAEVEAMKLFLCKNCEYKQHQCFICGVLEPSNGAAAKVFLCNNATCGHFYHPKCVAQQLHPNNIDEASELEKKITDGFSFTCPIHWCFHCKGLEDRTQGPLQFAVCRRCPKSYHRKCLPREISFDEIEEKGVIIRAWELSKMILIYCLNHEIDSELETPVRDHIKFPRIEKPLQFVKKGANLLPKKKKRTYSESILEQPPKDTVKMKSKVRMQESEQNKHDTREVSVKSFTQNVVDTPVKKKGKLKENKQLPYVAKDHFVSSPKSVKEQEQELVPLPLSGIRKSSFPKVDSEIEKRVISILGNEISSLTIKDVTRNCSLPSTHVYSGRPTDKMPLGKIERSVQAVEAALKKLKNGGSVNDAKAVCEPDVLRQLARWHIVDFCCGSNDFSRLMKEKLDKVQKKCHFKNYDLIQPQHHFCFEKRDWMTVQPNELPRGSQLIMGLNPPFGVKASLANKFIDKALTFKPKLIVLIVPKETKRLDKKKIPYDLIWEDSECLAGKSFYLPGSVDLNDNTVEGWNASAPPLYLWSHPHWTKKHMQVAEEHGHTCMGKIASHVEKRNLSDDLPVRKQSEAANKWNSRSGKETTCNDRKDNLLDDVTAKKQAGPEEEKETLGKMDHHVKKATIPDSLTVKKQTEASSKALSHCGNDRKIGRYSSRKYDDWRSKRTPDHEESFPPEKQVEVAYEETKVIIPSKKITHNEQSGACRENRKNSCVEETKNVEYNYEQQTAAGMRFREGEDSDMSISPPSRPVEPFDMIAHPIGSLTKEPFDPVLNRGATHQDSYAVTKEEYLGQFKRKNDRTFTDIDDSSRMRGSSIEEVTRPYIAAPTSDPYSLRYRGDGSFYRHPSSEDLNTTGISAGYGQIGGDSYPQATGSQTHNTRMHGGTSDDNYLSARYSLGYSGSRFSQPASTVPAFGLSGASSQRGSVIDKYSYGLSGPTGPQDSGINRYAPPDDGTSTRSKSSLAEQQYPFGQSGSSGGEWPHI